eukprot:470152_1
MSMNVKQLIVDGYTKSSISHDFIQKSGKYHWAFNISNSHSFRICLTKNRQIVLSEWSGLIDIKALKLNVYVDADNKILIVDHTWIKQWTCKFCLHRHQHLNSGQCEMCHKKQGKSIRHNAPLNLITPKYFVTSHIINSKLQIDVTGNNAKIEMLVSQSSHLYNQRLSHNILNPITHIEYAQFIHFIQEKIKHYAYRLRIGHFVTSYETNMLLDSISSNDKQLQQYEFHFTRASRKIRILIHKYYCCVHVENYDEYFHVMFTILQKLLLDNNKLINLFTDPDNKNYIVTTLNVKPNIFDRAELNKVKSTLANAKWIHRNRNLLIKLFATIHYENKNFNLSLLLFSKLSEKYINLSNLNGEIARCYRKTENYDKALSHYKLFLQKNPNDLWTYTQLSYLFETVGKPRKAAKYAFEALNYAETFDDYDEIYYQMGICSDDAGQTQLALICYRLYLQLHGIDENNDKNRCIECSQTVTTCITNMAMIYHDNGNYTQALSLFNKLNDSVINNNHRACIAFCHKMLGNNDTFLKYLKMCINEYERNGKYDHEWLCDLYQIELWNRDRKIAKQYLLMGLELVNCKKKRKILKRNILKCKQCSHCKTFGKVLKLCIGCKNTYYCSKKCQKRSWNSQHRFLCS